MHAIPTNRPVIGRDLKIVQDLYGLTTSDSCYLLGLSITAWSRTVNKEGDQPVKNPSLALLVRLLANNPSLDILPQSPSAMEMHEFLNGIVPTDFKRLSILHGAEASAGTRWKNGGSRQVPAVSRLMLALHMLLLATPKSGRAKRLEDWTNVVAAEGEARGAGNVLKTGRWQSEEVIAQSKQSIGAKKAFAAKKGSQDSDAPKAKVKKGTVAAKKSSARAKK